MKLYQRIETLCAAHSITVTELCRACGVSRSSLTDLKMGRKQSLSAQTLARIAGYFSVSVDSLLGVEPRTSWALTILPTRCSTRQRN